jgi:hypothetical protein
MSVNELNRWDWLAFCYLSDELSADERAAFEESLAADQVAREALSRAVELTCVISMAESRAASPTLTAHSATGPLVATASHVAAAARGCWSRRASWMAVGAAASLLLMVVASNRGYFQPADSRPTLAVATDDHRLATAWIATRTEFPIQASNSWASEDSPAQADAAFESTATVDELMADETPSWMTAALLAQAGTDGGTGAATNMDESHVERLEN